MAVIGENGLDLLRDDRKNFGSQDIWTIVEFRAELIKVADPLVKVFWEHRQILASSDVLEILPTCFKHEFSCPLELVEELSPHLKTIALRTA